MAQFTNLTATSETEAVNQLLSAIGESPVSDVDTAMESADVEMAVNCLRNATREMLSQGWRFNTEWGLALDPAGTQAWTDSNGDAHTLNVFTPADNLCWFRMSRTTTQRDMDVDLRPSKLYAGGGTVVFYDRTANRDGFPDTERDVLFIDAAYFFDFEDLPEVARKYAIVVATRQFIKDSTSDLALSESYELQERRALRNLRREYGLKDRVNLFAHPDMVRMNGNRIRPMGYYTDLRSDP